MLKPNVSSLFPKKCHKDKSTPVSPPELKANIADINKDLQRKNEAKKPELAEKFKSEKSQFEKVCRISKFILWCLVFTEHDSNASVY